MVCFIPAPIHPSFHSSILCARYINVMYIQFVHCYFYNYKQFFVFYIPVVTTQMEDRTLFPRNRKTAHQLMFKDISQVCSPVESPKLNDYKGTMKFIFLLHLPVRSRWELTSTSIEGTVILFWDFQFPCMASHGSLCQ